MDQVVNIVVDTEKETRIDKILASHLEQTSRQQVQKLIETEKVYIGEELVTKSSLKVKPGETITVHPADEVEQNILPVDLPLDIVYEDEHLIVVNKARGMVTHPAPGHYDDTLVNALLFHTSELSKLDTDEKMYRPGIVHRLDKDTSGLLVVAKNDFVHTLLSMMIAKRKVTRKYFALVNGSVEHEQFSVEMPIARSKKDRQKMAVDSAGKYAKTNFSLIDRNKKYSLLECQLDTGRTHQIRVHLESINLPIVGDPVYSRFPDTFGLGGQFLHAYQLSFTHPVTEEEMCFTTELPKIFKDVLEAEDLQESLTM